MLLTPSVIAADACTCYKMGYSEGAFGTKKVTPEECRDFQVPGQSTHTFTMGKMCGSALEGRVNAKARKSAKWLNDRQRECDRYQRLICF